MDPCHQRRQDHSTYPPLLAWASPLTWLIRLDRPLCTAVHRIRTYLTSRGNSDSSSLDQGVYYLPIFAARLFTRSSLPLPFQSFSLPAYSSMNACHLLPSHALLQSLLRATSSRHPMRHRVLAACFLLVHRTIDVDDLALPT